MITCLKCGAILPIVQGTAAHVCADAQPVFDPASPVVVPTGTKTSLFATGATRDADNGKLDYEGFLAPSVLKRYAEYMHACRTRNVPPGQAVRASDNWQKGIPRDRYMKSLVRHVFESWDMHRSGAESIETATGERLTFDDVLCAIMFNVMGYLFERLAAVEGRPGAPIGL